MSNPQLGVLKKYMFEMLKERYPKHQLIIERVASSLVTPSDLEDFGKMIVDIYELGFLKAVNDYKSQVEKAGMKINIVPSHIEMPNKTPIFNQKNQVDL